MWKVQLFKLTFDEKEQEAALRVLKRAWLPMGPECAEFETRFAESQGSRYCLTLNSCTAALHLAVKATGIKPGDEVILPSLTFAATANAVRYVGATPVFCDVTSAQLPVIDPGKAEELITDKTKAIIVVHYAGYPCDMNAFSALAKKHNLKLIEDCAHCPGATWNGKHLGTWGDAGCFSFYSNKNLSMGEGGAILVQTEELRDRIKLLRSHGMTTPTLDRYKGHAFGYDVIDVGYNYRLDEIRAAIGLAQLEKLPFLNRRRRELTILYRSLLADTKLEVPFADYPKADGVDHIMPVFLPATHKREKVMQVMKEEGIQTSIHYPGVHTFSGFKDFRCGDLSVTEDLCNRELTLPLYPDMTDDDVRLVVAALGKAIDT